MDSHDDIIKKDVPPIIETNIEESSPIILEEVPTDMSVEFPDQSSLSFPQMTNYYDQQTDNDTTRILQLSNVVHNEAYNISTLKPLNVVVEDERCKELEDIVRNNEEDIVKNDDDEVEIKSGIPLNLNLAGLGNVAQNINNDSTVERILFPGYNIIQDEFTPAIPSGISQFDIDASINMIKSVDNSNEYKYNMNTIPPPIDKIKRQDQMLVDHKQQENYNLQHQQLPHPLVDFSVSVSSSLSGNQKRDYPNLLKDPPSLQQMMSTMEEANVQVQQHPITRTSRVELHYITDNLLAAPSNICNKAILQQKHNEMFEAVSKTQTQQQSSQVPHDNLHQPRQLFSSPPIHSMSAWTPENTPVDDVGPVQVEQKISRNCSFSPINDRTIGPPSNIAGNDPHLLCNYVDGRHGAGSVLIFHIGNHNDSSVAGMNQQKQIWLDAFNYQIVYMPWPSAGSVMGSETPCLGNMIQICYAISSWLLLSQTIASPSDDNNSNSNDKRNTNVTIISCPNGKTKTALVCACYLKFSGIVNHSRDGFCHFIEQHRRAKKKNENGISKGEHDEPTIHGDDVAEDIKMLVSAEDIYEQLPPSIKTFFNNFDSAIELCNYMNRKPLLLKAIAIQGIPVEDRPCLDLWDGRGNHIYSSHPHLWGHLYNHQRNLQLHSTTCSSPSSPCTSHRPFDNAPTIKKKDPIHASMRHSPHTLETPTIHNTAFHKSWSAKATQNELSHNQGLHHNQHPHIHHGPGITSQWADEEGFYRVNQIISGDFCLLCRFGGQYATLIDEKNPSSATSMKINRQFFDPTRILFRYANTTAFMSGAGHYELPSTKVDLMRRYATSFEPDDFLVSLIWEQYWNYSGNVSTNSTTEPQNVASALKQDIGGDVLPAVYPCYSYEAVEEGWKLIMTYHAASQSPKRPITLRENSAKDFIEEKMDCDFQNDQGNDVVEAFLHECCHAGVPSELKDNCPNHIIRLALLLTNYDSSATETILLEGRLRQLWVDTLDGSDDRLGGSDRLRDDKSHSSPDIDRRRGSIFRETLQRYHGSINNPRIVSPDGGEEEYSFKNERTEKEALNRINSILDSIDVVSKLNQADLIGLDEANKTSEPRAQSGERNSTTSNLNSKQSTCDTLIVAAEPRSKHDGSSLWTSTSNLPKTFLYASPIMRPHPGDVVSTLSASRISSLMARYRDGNVNTSYRASKETWAYDGNKSNNNNNSRNNSPSSLISSFMGEHPLFPVVPRRTRQIREPIPIENPDNDAALELLLQLHHPGVHLQDLLNLVEKSKRWNNSDEFDESQLTSSRSGVLGGRHSTVEVPPAKRHPMVVSPQEEDRIKMQETRQSTPTSEQNETSSTIQDTNQTKRSLEIVRAEDMIPSEKVETSAVMEAMLKKKAGETSAHAPQKQGAAAVMEEMLRRNQTDGLEYGKPSGKAEASAAMEAMLKKKAGETSSHAPQKQGAAAVMEEMLRRKQTAGLEDGKPSGKVEASAAMEAMLKKKAGETSAHAPQKQGTTAVMEEMLKKKQTKGAEDRKSLGKTEASAAMEAILVKKAGETSANVPQKRGAAAVMEEMLKKKTVAESSNAPKTGAAAVMEEILKKKGAYNINASSQSEASAKIEGMLKKGNDSASKLGAAVAIQNMLLEKHGVDDGGASVSAIKGITKEKFVGENGAITQTLPSSSAAAAAMSKMLVKKLGQEDDFDNATMSDIEPPLKNDPRYQKYFKMLNMGLPEGAVKNAMMRDEVDPWILDLNPDKSYQSQATKEENKVSGNDPILKDDPTFTKYFKMLKMGLPSGAVKNAMDRDGLDSSILDLDHDKSLKAQRGSTTKEEDGVPLKDEPVFQKYYKMKKMGLPDGAIRNAMERDGVDPTILDLDPEKSLQAQRLGGAKEDDNPPIKDDPSFAKYFKMLKMGLPDGAVRNAMDRDGADPFILDLDPNKSLKSQRGGGVDDDDDYGPPLKDDPIYQKFFKMRKMGLPEGAVKNAMEREGVDSTILDLDPEKSLKSQRGDTDTGVPLKDDPQYQKYLKMRKMGLPDGAIANAMERDGVDPAILNLDPEKSVEFQLKPKNKLKKTTKKKKRVRRKKIYWNPLDQNQIKEDSLWSMVKGRVQMSHLKYDEQEFADLFTESADPKDKKPKKESSEGAKAKKAVQVIDGKRSMNGGIILQRLRLSYKDIAHMVDTMEAGNLDSNSIKSLKELLATTDEKIGLLNYMKQAGSTAEAKEKAYSELSEAEKYMFTMFDVLDADAKFDCMLFRSQFGNRFDELMDSIKIVEKACDEIRNSDKLRSILAMILTVVNQINTGGEGNEAPGFALDALTKLNEAKAFDKKTSVLHYVVKLVQRNDESLLDVSKDLVNAKDAELVVLDSLCGDIKTLNDEILPVFDTAKKQADELEHKGDLKPMSVQELREQRSSIRNVANVPQYNKVNNHTGRTSMERFTLNAKTTIDEALEYIDNVKEKFTKLLEYFGEDSNTPSNDFFGTLNRFMADFGKAVEHVVAQEKLKKKEQEKALKEREKRSKVNPKECDKDLSENDVAIENLSGRTSISSASKPGSAIAAMTSAIAARKNAEAARKDSSAAATVENLKANNGGACAPAPVLESAAAAMAEMLKKKQQAPEPNTIAKQGAAAVMEEMLKRKQASDEIHESGNKDHPAALVKSQTEVGALMQELLKKKQGTAGGKSGTRLEISTDNLAQRKNTTNEASSNAYTATEITSEQQHHRESKAKAIMETAISAEETKEDSEDYQIGKNISEGVAATAKLNQGAAAAKSITKTGAAAVMEEMLKTRRRVDDDKNVSRSVGAVSLKSEVLVQKHVGESSQDGQFRLLPGSSTVTSEIATTTYPTTYLSIEQFCGEPDATATKYDIIETKITDLPSESGPLPNSSIVVLEAAAAAADQFFDQETDFGANPDAIAKVYRAEVKDSRKTSTCTESLNNTALDPQDAIVLHHTETCWPMDDGNPAQKSFAVKLMQDDALNQETKLLMDENLFSALEQVADSGAVVHGVDNVIEETTKTVPKTKLKGELRKLDTFYNRTTSLPEVDTVIITDDDISPALTALGPDTFSATDLASQLPVLPNNDANNSPPIDESSPCSASSRTRSATRSNSSDSGFGLKRYVTSNRPSKSPSRNALTVFAPSDEKLGRNGKSPNKANSITDEERSKNSNNNNNDASVNETLDGVEVAGPSLVATAADMLDTVIIEESESSTTSLAIFGSFTEKTPQQENCTNVTNTTTVDECDAFRAVGAKEKEPSPEKGQIIQGFDTWGF